MSHRPGANVDPRTRRALSATAILLALLTIAGLYLLRPTGAGERTASRELGLTTTVLEARVESLQAIPCTGTLPEAGVTCTLFEVRLLRGPDAGGTVTIERPVGPGAPVYAAGERVMVAFDAQAQPGFEYAIVDRYRKPPLFWLALLFSLTVVLLGRLRGFAALVGLAASLVVLLRFVLPAVLDGRSPVLVAVVGAAAIAYLALYLAHGLGAMTTVALLGTLASLFLTAALATVFVDLAQLTGLASEEAFIVNLGAGGSLDIRGLILGGMVIGALGAIDDMTVTQASAVWELRAANPAMKRRHLYRAGLRIGRDHVASTVNTLVLAYAGASMPILLLFVLAGQSLGTVANGEAMATEIVRTLVGSIGLVAAVPLTTWLAAMSAGAPEARPTAERPAAREPATDAASSFFAGAHEERGDGLGF